MTRGQVPGWRDGHLGHAQGEACFVLGPVVLPRYVHIDDAPRIGLLRGGPLVRGFIGRCEPVITSRADQHQLPPFLGPVQEFEDVRLPVGYGERGGLSRQAIGTAFQHLQPAHVLLFFHRELLALCPMLPPLLLLADPPLCAEQAQRIAFRCHSERLCRKKPVSPGAPAGPRPTTESRCAVKSTCVVSCTTRIRSWPWTRRRVARR